MNPATSDANAPTLHSGFVPGLDIVRLTAATAVLVSHAFPITAGTNVGHEPLFVLTGGVLTIGELAVMVFFVVSGFLIAQSAERTGDLIAFTLKRALRIMPALIVVVMMTIFVLGPAVTTLPVSRYALSPATLGYFKNALFLPTTGFLPGVFELNPFAKAVNGSLWTLRFEVACYILLAASWFVLRGRAGWAQAGIMIAAMAASLIEGPQAQIFYLAAFFFAGATLYAARRFVVLSPVGGLACIIVMAASVPFGLFMAFGPLALGYVILWIGMALRAPRWLAGVDYSYGIYLYAFPVQQTVQMLLPGPWWQNALLSLPPTLLLAVCSWHLVEALAMRWSKQPNLKPLAADAAG